MAGQCKFTKGENAVYQGKVVEVGKCAFYFSLSNSNHLVVYDIRELGLAPGVLRPCVIL